MAAEVVVHDGAGFWRGRGGVQIPADPIIGAPTGLGASPLGSSPLGGTQ